MYQIDYRRIHLKLNKGYNLPKQILNNKYFLKNHNMLLGGMDKYTLIEKSNIVGHCINVMLENGVNDETMKVAQYLIDRLHSIKSKNKDNVELINIIYSTLIRKVTVADLISGRVSPQVYRDMVDGSIKNYIENPKNGNIDYRHVAGRMVTLKNMYKTLQNSIGKPTTKFLPIKWTDDMQLDYLSAMEKILNDYETCTENFVVNKGFRYNYIKKNNYSSDIHKERYRENIIDLFKLIYSKVCSLMKEPRKNREAIEDKIEIAYAYFDKIPYSDPELPMFIKEIIPLKELAKKLSKMIRRKKTSVIKSCLYAE